MTIVEDYLMETIKNWDPRLKNGGVHCSNCLHCCVGGEWPAMIAYCKKDHGKRATIRLAGLLRARGAGFQAAATCPDFSSMDD